MNMAELEEALVDLVPPKKTIWCHPDDRRAIESALETLEHTKSFDVVPSWVCNKGEAFVGQPVRIFR